MPKSAIMAWTCYLLLGTVFEWSLAAEAGKRQYQIQNGACSYTFLLPQEDNCQQSSSYKNLAQKDDPADYDESFERLEQLENIMENNTQWLLKVGRSPPHLISLQVCDVMATLACCEFIKVFLLSFSPFFHDINETSLTRVPRLVFPSCV